MSDNPGVAAKQIWLGLAGAKLRSIAEPKDSPIWREIDNGELPLNVDEFDPVGGRALKFFIWKVKEKFHDFSPGERSSLFPAIDKQGKGSITPKDLADFCEAEGWTNPDAPPHLRAPEV